MIWRMEPIYRIEWKNWADGTASAKVFRVADNSVVAVHAGKRDYVWNLIVRRGYNR